MKLECSCGQTYTYDHTKAGRTLVCTHCKASVAVPAFQSLSLEDQTFYRKEVEKKQRKLQQEEEKKAARVQKEKARIEHNRRKQGADISPAVRQAHSRLMLAKTSPHIRKILFDAEILYASRPALIVLILQLIWWAIPSLPFVLFLLIQCPNIEVSSPLEMAALVLVIIGIFILPVILYFQWRNQYYIITKERTIVSRGIFNVAISIVLNEHIQLVLINTGLLDSLLGLSGVAVSTAAQGGTDGIMQKFFGLTRGGVQLKHVEVKDVLGCYEKLQG